MSALFSEKTRSTKSPSRLGSKVEGTTTYSPGGSRKRVLTSRRLMNCSERAREALARKKSRFRWTPDCPVSCRDGTGQGAVKQNPPERAPTPNGGRGAGLSETDPPREGPAGREVVRAGRVAPGSTGRRRGRHRYLVDGEADGLHVLALAALAAPVLLHERQQEAAAGLAAALVVVIVVHLLQLDLELGVDPEGGWKQRGGRLGGTGSRGVG